MRDVARRIAAILVTLALVFGPAVAAVNASSMATKTAVAAASNMHSPGTCSGCGASKATMSGGVCSIAFCSGFTAFPVAIHAGLDWVLANTLVPYDARHMTGRAVPPNPYPPRPTILS